MKTKIITLGIFALTATLVGAYPYMEKKPDTNPVIPVVATEKQPRIQLAILLDTSSSMSGLINQTRDQLWQMVNEFAKSKKDGVTPKLEVAVYEYGNTGLSAESGFIRQVTPFTRELDQVSEALFALTTNGGDEYCGYVIQTAVNQLNWSKNEQDIRTIFIAGNEPFTQGPVPFQQAIKAAKAKGITVNTIHAGSADASELSGWRDGAVLAGGDYMSIDHNQQVAHFNAPQDKRLAELNAQLNNTYIPFGTQGRVKKERQVEQDQKNAAISQGLLAKRAASKASSMYENSAWDLVDAVKQGKVDVAEVPAESLPPEMTSMSKEEKKSYVKQKKEERARIQEEIGKLSKEREAYVAKQVAASPAPAASTVKDAMTKAIRKEAEKKHYEYSGK